MSWCRHSFPAKRTTRSTMSCWVALIPGWDREWRRIEHGTSEVDWEQKDEEVPVLVTQTSVVGDPKCGTVAELKGWGGWTLECPEFRVCWPVPWPWPRNRHGWRLGSLVKRFTGARESAFATGFTAPLTCLMSAVNWETKSRWRVCPGVYLSEWVASAKVKRFVVSQAQTNSRPSTKWRKCSNSQVDGQQFSVKGAVSCFCWAQLPGEVRDGAPSTIDVLLQYCSNSTVWSIGHNGGCGHGVWGAPGGWRRRELVWLRWRQYSTPHPKASDEELFSGELRSLLRGSRMLAQLGMRAVVKIDETKEFAQLPERYWVGGNHEWHWPFPSNGWMPCALTRCPRKSSSGTPRTHFAGFMTMPWSLRRCRTCLRCVLCSSAGSVLAMRRSSM